MNDGEREIIKRDMLRQRKSVIKWDKILPSNKNENNPKINGSIVIKKVGAGIKAIAFTKEYAANRPPKLNES
ncbi:hypothetical protein J4467_03270 [Candidatus Woesearchaeota archaeon]|nr:hypothetical protein [Candidatus Woesearchaeota archaeon]